MTRAFVLAAGLAFLGASLASGQSNDAIAKGIHSREVQWRTAISLGNWAAAKNFMAPDFVVTDAEGNRMDRDEYLKALQRGEATYAPVPDPTYKVLVYGLTAVHLGEANLIVTGSDGASTRTHIVWTDTWVRTPNGQWFCLAAQYTGHVAS
jgi:ketosteroid isomerase-like protein